MRNASLNKTVAPGQKLSHGIVREAGRRISQQMREQRLPLSRVILDNVADWEKFAARIQEDPGGADVIALELFGAQVDYLIAYLQSGDVTFRQLYIGEKLKGLHLPTFNPEQQRKQNTEIIAADTEGILKLLCKHISSEDLAWLQAELDAIHSVVKTPSSARINVLMIGDCLFLDIITFLAPACLEDGIEINPIFIGSRNPVELRKQVSDHCEGIKLVFFSPFTYDFSPHYSQSTKSAWGISQPGSVRRFVEPDIEEIKLDREFACRSFCMSDFRPQLH